MGQEEVGGVTCRVTCTWWQLWLAVQMPWLALGGRIFSLGHTIGLAKLSKCYSHLVGASFLAVKAIWVLNGCLLAENAD